MSSNDEAAASNGGEMKKYVYKSGATYEGQFDGNKRHGRGHWSHPQGETYEGEYVNNRPEGLGVYTFSDSGKRYVGTWAGGRMNGEGVYYFNHDASAYFHGTYVDDMKEGEGHYMYESGLMTKQRWAKNKLVSEEEASPLDVVKDAVEVRRLVEAVQKVAPRELGELPPPSEVRTFQFPSGATYTGQYFGTKKHGRGYWLHPEGDSYEGQFVNNKHNGWGVYVIGRSGKKYVGEWRGGKMHGMGVYFFNPMETEYYVGLYQDDVKNGRGLYHFSESGNSKMQLWENGVLTKEADADPVIDKDYVAAVKEIISIVKPFAPNYEPVFAA